jgi:hypothetical protein
MINPSAADKPMGMKAVQDFVPCLPQKTPFFTYKKSCESGGVFVSAALFQNIRGNRK